MALEMKTKCQSCDAPFGWQDEVLINALTSAVGVVNVPKVMG